MLPTCRESTLLLDALADADVPLFKRLGARFHFRTCHKCRRFSEQYRATADALGSLASPPSADAPSAAAMNAFRAWRSRG